MDGMTVRRAWVLAIGLLAVSLLAGCASQGPAADPAGRKLSWFSYLSGDDLRPVCAEDGPDRYRMVFNADYNQHVRTYDVTGDLRQGGEIQARVIKAADLSRVDLANPLAPWQGDAARTPLSPRQFAALMLHLYESGAFKVEPGGLRLPSNGVYWLVSGCRGGQWFFSAYPYPSDRFRSVRFAEGLEGLDGTGVPFPALPDPQEAVRTLPPGSQQKDGGVFFELTVADGGGLVGPTALFGPWLFR